MFTQPSLLPVTPHPPDPPAPGPALHRPPLSRFQSPSLPTPQHLVSSESEIGRRKRPPSLDAQDTSMTQLQSPERDVPALPRQPNPAPLGFFTLPPLSTQENPHLEACVVLVHYHPAPIPSPIPSSPFLRPPHMAMHRTVLCCNFWSFPSYS